MSRRQAEIEVERDRGTDLTRSGGALHAGTNTSSAAESPFASRERGDAVRRPTGLAVGVAVLVLLGIGFRLVGLGEKPYWHDEVYTSIRVYGYTGADIRNTLTPGTDVAPTELQALQRRGDRTSGATMLRSLASEDPQHPPLYYGLLYAWTAAFGDSIATLRVLSVLASLLILPAAAWLCRELFPERQVAWVIVGLVALSPVQVLYAQEAREYIVWELLIVLSTAALLWARRRGDRWGWALYSVAMTLGYYTCPLHAFVAVAHGVYVLAWGPERRRERLTYFGLASLGALIAFAPWLWIMWAGRDVTAAGIGHLSRPATLSDLVRGWVIAFSLPFAALAGEEWLYERVPKAALYGLHAAVLACVGWCFVVMWRNLRKPEALLVTTLAAGVFLAMLVPDLLVGGTRSTTVRYLVPTWAALLLVVAFGLTRGMLGRSTHPRARWAWTGVAALLVGSALASNALVVTTAWGNKPFGGSRGDVAFDIARQINAAARPLILLENLAGDIPGESITLSYLVGDHARFRLAPDVTAAPDLSGYSDIFVFRPTEAYRQAIGRHATLEETARWGAFFRAAPR